MTITVREGIPEDLDAVMELARMLHAESGLVDLTPDRILPEIWSALHYDKGIMGVIGPEGGPLQAAIMLRIAPYFYYSQQEVLQERGLFVHPDHRTAAKPRAHDGSNRAPHAALLCDFAKHVADQLDLPLFIGVSKDVLTKGKVKLFERHFGEPVATLYRYVPHAEAKAEAA